MCIPRSNGEVGGDGEGVRGDDSNVKAITVDHPARCPSGVNGVGECQPDSRISACGFEGRRLWNVTVTEKGEGHGPVEAAGAEAGPWMEQHRAGQAGR
jgi:hypothetical protein